VENEGGAAGCITQLAVFLFVWSAFHLLDWFWANVTMTDLIFSTAGLIFSGYILSKARWEK